MRPAKFRLDVAAVLREAWGLARQDNALLLGIAGVFLFVPQLALLLYWTDPPALPAMGADPAVWDTYSRVSEVWLARNGFGMLFAALTAAAAPVAILLLYLDPRRLDVADALIATPALFFPALLAGLIASPIALTLLVSPPLILLGAYLQGRLLLVLPALIGERPHSVFGAIGKSWTRTRGHGLMMAGLACIAVLAGPVLSAPLRLAGMSFGGAPLANPFVAVLIHASTALVLVAGAVLGVLIQVAAYRRLSSGT